MCGELVCITPMEVAELVKWIATVIEIQTSLAKCPFITKEQS